MTEDQDRFLARTRARAQAVEVLTSIAAGGDSAGVPLLVAAVEAAVPAGPDRDAYLLALQAIQTAMEWAPAVRAADANPLRFRDAARAMASDARGKVKHLRPDLDAALTALETLADPAGVRAAAGLMARVSLPFVATNVMTRSGRWARPEPPPPQAPVVIVRLSVHGTSLSSFDVVRRDALLDLEAVVKVDRWPETAESLRLSFEADVSGAVFECGEILIKRDADAGRTRLVLRADVHPSSPIEVAVAASFVDAAGGLTPARFLGDRTMRLATATAGGLPAGAEVANERIIEMLAELEQVLPDLPADHRRDLTLLLGGSNTFAKRVQDGDVFDAAEKVDEKKVLQPRLKLVLSGHPEIGLRLQEATEQAGGETDLVLGQVVDELKVERDDAVTLDNAVRHLSQPTHYASVGHSQVSVLTILDLSSKVAPPGVPANYMGWLRPRLHGLEDPEYPSMVAVVIIPGAFPRPSDWQHMPDAVAEQRDALSADGDVIDDDGGAAA